MPKEKVESRRIMDNRAELFIRKFSDAQDYLGVESVQKIVSLKYRGDVHDTSYPELIDDHLRKVLNFKTERVQGDFQGNAWLITDKNSNKAILVEHETGLEILYVAGSVASLLSLLPVIGSAWHFIQAGYRMRPIAHDLELEKRILDSNNQLIEQHTKSFELHLLTESLRELLALQERVNQLEQQIIRNEKNKRKPRKSTNISKKGKK